ncbi:MAG: glucosaminidase domain-containing protein [Bacilli bacterium]
MKINQKIVFISLLITINVILMVLVFNKNDERQINVEADSNHSKATSIAIKEEKPKPKTQVTTPTIEEIKTELPVSEPVIIKNIVYDGMTIEEISAKLDRSLNSSLSGQGITFVNYCLELGVDPYLAVAIALHETGCNGSCSGLVTQCNNVGGQKGTGCGDTGYQAYATLEEGIKGFINNIYYNYYVYGLTTPDTMNTKYAESTTWAAKVNTYIQTIKAS